MDVTPSGHAVPAEPKPVARLQLGTRAPWTGPAAFSLAVLVYVLGVAFEAHVADARSGFALPTLFSGVGVPDFSAREYLAHMEWRASVFLLIGASLAAALVALHSVSGAVRRAPLQVAVISGVAVVAVVVYFFILVDPSEPVAFMGQVKKLFEEPRASSQVAKMASLAIWPKRCAEGVAFLVGAGAASIVVLPETIDAMDLARRVRALRLLLYTTAVLFVVVIVMTESTYSWLVTFFAPEDERVRSALESLVATGTLSAGAFYTLMLTAIYVPAAAALGHVGRRLADVAMSESSDDDVAAWMERNGLSISWRGQLARVGTLLAPLLSTGLAQVLTAAG